LFTGLVQSIGQVRLVYPADQSLRFTIESDSVCDKVKTGDSIAVNGACLTVESITGNRFQATAVRETLGKTNLGFLKTGSYVNLETALRFNDSLGGHLVQGHIDCVGKIITVTSVGGSHLMTVQIPNELNLYLIEKGSIAVDGVSLTLTNIQRDRFTVAIIPHTWENTILKYANSGSIVNIEFDYIGKWVEKFNRFESKKKEIDLPWLKSLGY
jgi:riboflavin synthase